MDRVSITRGLVRADARLPEVSTTATTTVARALLGRSYIRKTHLPESRSKAEQGDPVTRSTRNTKAVIIRAEGASAELPSVFYCIRNAVDKQVSDKLCVSLARESRGGNSFGERISTLYTKKLPFPSSSLGKLTYELFRVARNFCQSFFPPKSPSGGHLSDDVLAGSPAGSNRAGDT